MPGIDPERVPRCDAAAALTIHGIAKAAFLCRHPAGMFA